MPLATGSATAAAFTTSYPEDCTQAFGASKTKATNQLVIRKLDSKINNEKDYVDAAKILLACTQKKGKDLSFGELAKHLHIPYGAGHRVSNAGSKPTPAHLAGIKAPVNPRNAYLLAKLFASCSLNYRDWNQFFACLSRAGLIKADDFSILSQGTNKFRMEIPGDIPEIESHSQSNSQSYYSRDRFPHPANHRQSGTCNGLVENSSDLPDRNDEKCLLLNRVIQCEGDDDLLDMRAGILVNVLKSALPDSKENTMKALCNAFGVSQPISLGFREPGTLDKFRHIAKQWITEKRGNVYDFKDFLHCIQNCDHYPSVVETTLHNGYITNDELTKGHLSPEKLTGQPAIRHNTIAFKKNIGTFTKKQTEDFGKFLYLAFKNQSFRLGTVPVRLCRSNNDRDIPKKQTEICDDKAAKSLSNKVVAEAKAEHKRCRTYGYNIGALQYWSGHLGPDNSHSVTLKQVFGRLGAGLLHAPGLPSWDGSNRDELLPELLTPLGKELVEKTMIDGYLDLDNVNNLYEIEKRDESGSRYKEGRRQYVESHARPRAAVSPNPDGRKQPSAPPESLQPSAPSAEVGATAGDLPPGYGELDDTRPPALNPAAPQQPFILPVVSARPPQPSVPSSGTTAKGLPPSYNDIESHPELFPIVDSIPSVEPDDDNLVQTPEDKMTAANIRARQRVMRPNVLRHRQLQQQNQHPAPSAPPETSEDDWVLVDRPQDQHPTPSAPPVTPEFRL